VQLAVNARAFLMIVMLMMAVLRDTFVLQGRTSRMRKRF
jgi:hypothetical protein